LLDGVRCTEPPDAKKAKKEPTKMPKAGGLKKKADEPAPAPAPTKKKQKQKQPEKETKTKDDLPLSFGEAIAALPGSITEW
jgi:hypothetical protein